ncbi:dethiobiotin synthase [Corynebacterium sp. YIM 101645]|uniref:ATP-dependent dethiobiotin synthetase BioD n=1 Tax=Corynebacterium lemuris TaxID=1859292 RepID=A0ABT2FW00_9CORY|nr:dethiobiotin synthase [Corynebacterium lemuris]MCS5479406.1 dethiobiotin synthase [Corynebacterium lemuris]
MSIIVVTGTGPGVGKTITTAAIVSVLSERGMKVIPVKPVQTGVSAHGTGDAANIRRLTGVGALEFVRYPEPLVPVLAARRAGLPSVDRAKMVSRIRALDGPDRVVVVEGDGGLLVRLAGSLTIADLASDLGAPLIVVTPLGVGSLNAAELTVTAAHARGLHVRGLVGGSLPADPDLATRENLAELPWVTGVPMLGCLPEGAGSLDPVEFRSMARQSLDLDLGEALQLA